MLCPLLYAGRFEIYIHINSPHKFNFFLITISNTFLSPYLKPISTTLNYKILKCFVKENLLA